MSSKTNLSAKEKVVMFLIPIIGFMLYAVHYNHPEGQEALDMSVSGTFIYIVILIASFLL